MDNAPRSTSLLKTHDSKETKERKKKIGVDTFTEFCSRHFFLFNIIIIQMLKMYEQYVVAQKRKGKGKRKRENNQNNKNR